MARVAGSTSMAYNKTLLFVETTSFTNWLLKNMHDEEYRELQQYLMEHPEAGKVIRGGGGIRKLRWSRPGMGKSGGSRIIYYWAMALKQIYLFAAYNKTESENIDKKTLSQIAKQLEKIK
jgi:hypothetical protein